MTTENNITKKFLYFLVILIIVTTILVFGLKKTYAQEPGAQTGESALILSEAQSASAAQIGISVSDPGLTEEIGLIDNTKSNADFVKSLEHSPPGQGWLQQAYNWITAPSIVNTALSGDALVADRVRVAGEYVLKQALITLGHQLLVTMTNSTVAWINSGFHGSPLYVQNPDLFFGNIEKTEIKNLINDVGYDPRQPFGQQYALNIINQYKASSNRDLQSSMSLVTQNSALVNSYLNNFGSGGWNAFLLNTQYPQNNYVGYTMIANQLLASKLTGTTQTTTQKAKTLLSQGNGFLSPTMCPASINPNYNTMSNEFNPKTFAPNYGALPAIPDCISPVTGTSVSCSNQAAIDEAEKTPGSFVPQCVYNVDQSASNTGCVNQDAITAALDTYNTAYDAQQATFNQTNSCIDPKTGKSGLVATTPGAVVGNQIMTALNLKTGVAQLDSALGNSMSAILNALMNHFLSEGLSGLSSAITGTPSASDSWSYNGQTLTGTTGTNTTGALNIPTNVSLNAGDTTGTAVSGGTAPYSIATQPDNTIATAQIGADGASLSVTGISQGTTTVTIQDSSSTNTVTTAVPVAQVNTITIGGAIGTAGTLSATINSVTTSILVTSNDTTTTAATSLTNAINANSKINKTVIATNTTPGVITITSQTAGTASVFSLTSTNTTTALTATSATLTPASDGNTAQNQTAIVTITVGTNGNILLNFANLAKNPASISASVGNSINLTLSGGTQPYNIQTQPDSTIALALINNNTLTIVGVGPGATSLSLQDSSGITINLGITVGNETPLVASPSSVSTTASGTSTATIFGGTPPYVIASPSSNTAMATISGNTLTVTGSTQGSSSVTIQDSYSPAETITVPINIGASTITLSGVTSSVPQPVSVVAGTTTNITLSNVISGGTAPYSIQTPSTNSAVATATISGGILTITGVGQGSTTVVVKDSSTSAQTTTFNITVTPTSGSNTTF